MAQIPLTKRADLFETVQDFIWDPDRGPIENLLRLGENGLIVFGGGPLALVLFGLKAIGLAPSRVGRMIDEGNGLTSIGDFLNMDHEKAAQDVAKQLEKPEASSGGAGFGSAVGPEWSKSSAASKTVQKTASFGRFGIAAAFAAMFGWLAKGLMSPNSLIAKALRGAGLVWMESDQNPGNGQWHPGSKNKQAPSATKKTPKQQLEAAVDQILGA